MPAGHVTSLLRWVSALVAGLFLLAGCASPSAPLAASAGPYHASCAPPFRAPTDGGACVQWLSDGERFALEPSLAVDPRDAKHELVAWTVRDNIMAGPAVAGSSAEVFAAVTTDGGLSWRTTQMHDPSIPDAPGATRYAFDQRAAFARDGTALVLFGGEMTRRATAVDDGARVTLASSSDGGSSWSYRRVAERHDAEFDYFGFSVAPDSGTLYVATDEIVSDSMWLWSSADQGATWSGPSHVSRGPAGVEGENALPTVAAGPGGLVLVGSLNSRSAGGFDGEGVRASHDGGATFGPLVKAAPLEYSRHIAPSSAMALIAGQPVFHIALADANGGVFEAASSDAGVTWTGPTSLGRAGGPVYWNDIAAGSDGSVHMLARAGVGSWGVDWLARFADGSNASLHLAQDDRSPRQGFTPTNQNVSDDYGGLAIAQDGSVWTAFADPRGVDHSRIAVVRLVR